MIDPSSEAGPSRPSSLTKHWRMALWMAAITASVVWASTTSTTTESPLPSPPHLVIAPAVCGLSGSAASARAEDLLHRARMRWERAVFEPAALRAALLDAEGSVACLAGQDGTAALREAKATVAALRAQWVRDYRRLQLRLRIARDRNDAGSIRDAATALRAMIADDDDSYSRWLRALEQEARVQGVAP